MGILINTRAPGIVWILSILAVILEVIFIFLGMGIGVFISAIVFAIPVIFFFVYLNDKRKKLAKIKIKSFIDPLDNIFLWLITIINIFIIVNIASFALDYFYSTLYTFVALTGIIHCIILIISLSMVIVILKHQ